MENKYIYADNAATTRVTPSVLNAMLPYFTEEYGNPSAVCKPGQRAARAVLNARESIARTLGAGVREIFFTSGGSESDNWAIRGAAELGAASGKRHIVTTAVEHHAVLRTCASLADKGFEVTYLPVDEYGRVSADRVAAAVRGDTCLVSVMFANNEVGTIMPIPEIGRICREKGVLFHTDAVQAAGHIPIDVGAMGIDMLSLSGHKLHAPKGIGLLYVREGIELPPLITGGNQERGRRAGTENVPSVVGLARAVEDAFAEIPERTARLAGMRDRLAEGILRLPETRLNGHPTERLAGHVNVSLRGIEGESMLLMLDMNGICASSGSACTSGSSEPSHVLLAMGLPAELAHSSLRFTLGDDTSEEDIDRIIEVVTRSAERLRSMSPRWQAICGGK